MKVIILLIIIIFTFPAKIYAIEDPLKVANNKFGVHILFVSELQDAAQFVNTNGGDWGYVTIPIQIGDRDLIKWQTFMDNAKSLHVIPIIRLASQGDYFNTKVWEKPSSEDIIDFANFLDSLNWPTANRYVIVFNEPNRADEWGGAVNPQEYTQLLNFAIDVFKSRSTDFFIISAGLDNAAPAEYPYYMNEYTFINQMQAVIPDIFNKIDGFASHSYPNPGFSQSPYYETARNVASFKFERALIKSYRKSDIPVFITETGWNSPQVSDDLVSEYYNYTFNTVWNDPGIVAVTPFLLHAYDGPFIGFSLIKPDGTTSKQFNAIANLQKTKGIPSQTPFIMGIENDNQQIYPMKDFSNRFIYHSPFSLSEIFSQSFRWIMKL
jgi:hypothetical protein